MQILVSQLEPLTEQQLLGISNLQQSSNQAEDALSQGMEALQQSLAETLASGSTANVANYMGQMAMAMGKLGTLEGFLQQVMLPSFRLVETRATRILTHRVFCLSVVLGGQLKTANSAADASHTDDASVGSCSSVDT